MSSIRPIIWSDMVCKFCKILVEIRGYYHDIIHLQMHQLYHSPTNALRTKNSGEKFKGWIRQPHLHSMHTICPGQVKIVLHALQEHLP